MVSLVQLFALDIQINADIIKRLPFWLKVNYFNQLYTKKLAT